RARVRRALVSRLLVRRRARLIVTVLSTSMPLDSRNYARRLDEGFGFRALDDPPDDLVRSLGAQTYRPRRPERGARDQFIDRRMSHFLRHGFLNRKIRDSTALDVRPSSAEISPLVAPSTSRRRIGRSAGDASSSNRASVRRMSRASGAGSGCSGISYVA